MVNGAQRRQLRQCDLPDPADMVRNLQICRTPGKGKSLKLICLSPRHLGYYVHWFNGSTVGCIEEGCPACAKGVEVKWRGYVAVLGTVSNEIGIFEYPGGPAGVPMEYHRVHGSLRGALILAHRTGVRDNDRVRLLFQPSGKSAIELPPCPDVPEFLRRLWGIDTMEGILSDYSGAPEEEAFKQFQSTVRAGNAVLSTDSHNTNGRSTSNGDC